MQTKYSRQPFEGYTHRFIVKFSVDEDYRNDVDINIYSNSDSYLKLSNFVHEKKSDRVVSFRIEHRASVEQDTVKSIFIDEILKDL